MKDTVIFYKDWFKALAELTPEERLAAYDAVFGYAFEGVAPTGKLIRSVTALMRSAIDRDAAKYADIAKARSEAGKKGMSRRWGNAAASGHNNGYQKITNVTNITDNGNDNDNDNKNVNDNENGNGKEKKTIYPYQDIADLWNEVCGGVLPRVKALNANRRQKIKCRLAEFGGKGREDWLARARELFTRVVASDFLRGANKSGWTATFDWLFMNGENWVKVTEGNYDNDRSVRGAAQQRTRQGVTLGVGEWIDERTGRRTYGTGKATIPLEAPARPSERHSWDAATETWILL